MSVWNRGLRYLVPSKSQCKLILGNVRLNSSFDGLTTQGRVHTLSLPCEKAVRLVKMGFINKNLGVQYCHHLIQLSKHESGTDKDFYASKAFDLTHFLMRQGRELVESAKINLLVDMSSIDPTYCARACELVFNSERILDVSHPQSLRGLLESCYSFSLYDYATRLLNKFDGLLLDTSVFDPLVLGLMNFAGDFESPHSASRSRRQEFFDHLDILVSFSQKLRVQFITKYQEEFIKSLEVLGAEITKNPTIKLSCRCTNCNSYLPAFNGSETRIINSSIKSLLNTTVDERVLLHTSPEDLAKFESFLENAINIDGKPFDCVIDGLNVAYQNATGYNIITKSVQEGFRRTVKKLSPASLGQVLINTMIRSGVLQKFGKVLVVGRRHMRGWPNVIDFFEKNGIHHYLSFNHNADDLYSLYAATLNPKTVLITNDFLRDHKARIEQDNQMIFERWIDTRQAWIVKKSLKPIWPTPFEKLASKDETKGHFHLPVINSDRLADIAQHEPPPHLNSNMLTWLCCKIPSSCSSSQTESAK